MAIPKKQTRAHRMTPAVKKESTGITQKDIVKIRLECLLAVVEGGSRVDMNNPQAKAQTYFDWIMGTKAPKPKGIGQSNITSNIDELKNITTPSIPIPEPIKETVTAPPENNPFSDTGREQVML